MWRFGGWVLLGAALCSACNGFPDPVPIAEAEHKPEKYLSYAKRSDAPVVTVDGQRWVVLPGSTVVAPATAFRRLAGDQIGGLFTAAWDQAPYDALYVVVPGEGMHLAGELR
jgi:hypothetical protein